MAGLNRIGSTPFLGATRPSLRPLTLSLSSRIAPHSPFQRPRRQFPVPGETDKLERCACGTLSRSLTSPAAELAGCRTSRSRTFSSTRQRPSSSTFSSFSSSSAPSSSSPSVSFFSPSVSFLSPLWSRQPGHALAAVWGRENLPRLSFLQFCSRFFSTSHAFPLAHSETRRSPTSSSGPRSSPVFSAASPLSRSASSSPRPAVSSPARLPFSACSALSALPDFPVPPSMPFCRGCAPPPRQPTMHSQIRGYKPVIDWVKNRLNARMRQYRKRSLKKKNHSKVIQRFKLTRFGWQRLRSGRNGEKENLTHKQLKRTMGYTYVSRDDLWKFRFQLPSHILRIRDAPINRNPNIRKIRRSLPSYFG